MLKRLLKEKQILKLKDKLHEKKIKREEKREREMAWAGLLIGTVILLVCVQINQLITR